MAGHRLKRKNFCRLLMLSDSEKMNKVELSLNKSGCEQETWEILIALLLQAGFESFEEDDNFIKAYYTEDESEIIIPDLMKSVFRIAGNNIDYSIRKIPDKNWNQEWEKNFSPTIIDDRILIKAPFHQVPDLDYTVIIEPKMSFGTGHHETTRLMLREMLQIDFLGKEVLDMGCGTGVLGITAALMGASYVLAVDVDPWAFQNTMENFQLNNIPQPYDVFPGNAKALEGHTFHYILANINRNILLKDLEDYKNALKDNGTLIISGILTSDEKVLLDRANECGFTFIQSNYENNWISLNLKK